METTSKQILAMLKNIKSVNLSGIGERALNACLNEFKFRQHLSFLNIGTRYGRKLDNKRVQNMKYKYYGKTISQFTNTDSDFSELLFFKDYFSIINTKDYTIINSIIKFFCDDFIHKFYEEFKIRLLKKLNFNPKNFSIDIMKAIPNNCFHDIQGTGQKITIDFDNINDRLSDDVEFLSNINSLMVPFISFVDKTAIGKKSFKDDGEERIRGVGCLTLFTTSNLFYRGFSKYGSKRPTLDKGDLESLISRDTDFLSSSTLGKVGIVIGNLFNYLIIKVMDNNTKECGFVYSDKIGRTFYVLRTPLSIPYISSMFDRNNSSINGRDLYEAQSDYSNKKSEIQAYIKQHIQSVMDKISWEGDKLFRKEKLSGISGIEPGGCDFFSGFVNDGLFYKVKHDCIELHDSVKFTHVLHVMFYYCDDETETETCVMIEVNYDDLISDDDDFKFVDLSEADIILNNNISVKDIMVEYGLKPLKRNKELFKRMYYKDHPILQKLLNELVDLKNKVYSEKKKYELNKSKMFERVKFTGKDIDIQRRFTEMEFYTGSPDYGFKCITL